MRGAAGSAIVILAYVAVLFVMVRPGSKGPKFVTSISGGIASIVNAATGGGTWANG